MKFKKFGDEGENKQDGELHETSPEELLSMLLNPGVSSEGKQHSSCNRVFMERSTKKNVLRLSTVCCVCERPAFNMMENPEDPDGLPIQTSTPFDFHISTWGGSALDMFAVYDVMRLIRKDCEIVTYGFGKVMSAGVILLAAGTKGKRYIGANCRLMIHGVTAGQQGGLHDLENEMNEAKWIQKQYVSALSKESKMRKKEIKELFNRKINVYFDAEQAVAYGIADEIV